MERERGTLPLVEAPLEIIDGDRGVNYPKQNDFAPIGDCLFLNAGNVTRNGFSFSSLNFITKNKDALLRKGKLVRQDVVLTTRGTVGNAAFYDNSVPFDNVRINSGMVLLRANQTKLLPHFLYHFVRSSVFQEQVESLTTGSAQPQLPIRDIHRIDMPIPSIEEQGLISNVLGVLDDKGKHNQKMAAVLARLSRAVFRAWFVDFEPVKAKAEGATSFPAMPQPVFDAMPSRLIASDIGSIPEGWEMGTLGSLLKESTNRNNDEDIDLVLSAVNTGELVASDDHFNKRVYSKSLSNYKVVPSGAIAFNPSRINIGSVGVNHRDVAGVVSPAYVVCSALREYEWFFEFFLRLPGVRKQFETLSSGSVRQSLKVVDFLSVELAIPKRAMVQAFNHEFMHYRRLLASLDEESQKLAEIRDYLLPRLLSGSVRVEVVDG